MKSTTSCGKPSLWRWPSKSGINEDDGTASLDLAISVAGYFELEQDKAKAIAAEDGKAVSTWEHEAARHGVGKGEIDRMVSCV
jgi:serine/threonine-protein kinase HipA